MKVCITAGKANGTIIAPPSKSTAHRMLISSAMCHGTSRITGIAPSEDISATVDCIRALGASCEINNETAVVTGIDMRKAEPVSALGCRESGSTLRFLVPVCLLSGNSVELYGTKRLFERPLSVYAQICESRDIEFSKSSFGLRLKGRLTPGEYRLRADISSQFISGLIFALPLLDGDSTVVLEGKISSRPYIDLTMSALSQFGVRTKWENDNVIFVPGCQEYVPCDAQVEGDFSNAAFFEALNYLGGNVKIEGLNSDSAQGDRKYLEYFKMINEGMPSLDVTDCPDLAPVLMALGAYKNGVILTGTKRLKSKESNRGEAMAAELLKFGVEVSVGEDEIFVPHASIDEPKAIISGHNDHRIVMACAVLLTLTGGEIEGADAVRKSFPDFFAKLKQTGIGVKEIEIK